MKFIDWLAVAGFFLTAVLIDGATVFATSLEKDQKYAFISLSTFCLTVLVVLYVSLCGQDEL
jgi:hypothetical protein